MPDDWEHGSAPTDPTANAKWHADRGEAQRSAHAKAQQQSRPTAYVPPTLPTTTTTGTRGGGATGMHPYEQHEWMGVLARFLAGAGFLIGAYWTGSAGVAAGHGFWGAVIWGGFGGLVGAVVGWFAPLAAYVAVPVAIALAIIGAIFWIVSLF